MADVVTMWGETGTPASITIPCMVSKSVFDVGSPSDFYGTNGAALVTIFSDVTYAVTTAILPGDFSNAIVGMYAHATGLTSGNDGWFEIITITGTTSATIDITNLVGDAIQAGDDGDTLSVSIGGLGEITDNTLEFQALLDLMESAVGSTNNLDILLNQSFTIDTTIDIDNIGGSATIKHRLIGTSPSFVRDGTRVTIDTDSTITAIFDFNSGVIGMGFENIIYDGGGSGKADHCIYNNTDTEGQIYFLNCRMTNASKDGVFLGGTAQADKWTLTACEVDNNGKGGAEGWGIRNRLTTGLVLEANNCNIHENYNGGIRFAQDFSSIMNCRIWGNVNDEGILVSSSLLDNCMISNNTVSGNGGAGIYVASTSDFVTISNNSSVNNIGVGYELNGLPIGEFRFYNNHSKDNHFGLGTQDDGDTHCSETATLALFECFQQDNNISGDPDFDANFIPSSSSVLIDAGVGGTGDTIGALCATAGGGAGGGVMPMTGLLS